MEINTGNSYLDSLGLWSGKEFSLKTPKKLFAALGNPQDKMPTIHVAGTNGKGSVCTFLSAILYSAGYKVGQFASPHLSQVTERCLINGRPTSFGSFSNAVSKVAEAASREGLEPSFFEVTTAATFLVFLEEEVDFAVVEVGLGGRLDATNVIAAPKASVITNVSYDHEHILGDTLEAIAGEKGGIIKSNVPVFVGEVGEEVRRTLLQVGEERGAPIQFGKSDFRFQDTELGLLGKHQRQNAELAVEVASALGCLGKDIQAGLARARWPGRLEWISGEKPILLDAAHNIGGVQSLLEFLRELTAHSKSPRRICFLLSMLERKDWRQMLRALQDFCDVPTEFVFTSSGHGSAVPPEELLAFCGRGEVIEDCEEAVSSTISQIGKDTLLVISGSIFLIGKVRPIVTSRPFQTIAF